jgi:hypothetical protein
MEEHRRAESEWVDLARARGELVERTVALATMGSYVTTLVRILDALENRIAVQVEIWIDDAAFRALPSADRQRAARAWFAAEAFALRQATTDEIARKLESARIQETPAP